MRVTLIARGVTADPIERMLAEHEVTSVEVEDASSTVLSAAQDAVERGGLVLIVGGAAWPEEDPAFEALSRDLQAVPGFSAAFTQKALAEVGSPAIRMRAAAGRVDGALLVLLPGDESAVRVALEELLLPELDDLVGVVAAEEPSPTGFSVVPMDDEPAPTEALPWLATLAELGGRLDRKGRCELPPSIAKSAPVLEVLNTAGERGTTSIDGQTYGVYGFPDLRRATSKVLLIGPGEPIGEVVALHRLPAQVGVCRNGGGVLPSSGRLGRTCEELTGQDYPERGRLLAIDGAVVYVREGESVYSWDGRRRKPEGSMQATLASLLLGWSQR